MIKVRTFEDASFYVLESASELLDPTRITDLYLDVETQNNNEDEEDLKKVAGMYAYAGDRLAGFAYTVDDCPDVFYVPMRHSRGKNVDLEAAKSWLKIALKSCKRWINHNILFDAVFCHFEGADFECELHDTLTLAKMHDSDRYAGFGLKELGRDWLNLPMDEELRLKAYLRDMRIKSYADAPTDMMGEYACMDVYSNRKLFKFLESNWPEDMNRIRDIEVRLTPVLYDMEIRGLQTNELELKLAKRDCLISMISNAEIIERNTQREWTNSNQVVYDILCNVFGMPVLAYKIDRDDDGHPYITDRATFDKNALKLYQVHPTTLSDPKIKETIDAMIEFRKESQFRSLFIEPYLALRDDAGFIHPTYNQLVRTGRMSGRRPNAQQLNKRAKGLIHPRAGHSFISCDYSQIEFRLIVHYIQDEQAIRAYNEDPDTDFHQWIADLVGVQRRAAKGLNFGMGYGAGKRKVTAMLATNPDIIEEIGHKIAEMDIPPEHREAKYRELCEIRAAEAYQTYHERLPGIKQTSEFAASIARRRGWVFNGLGRRRHLLPEYSRKAFNSIIQGFAMDLMKERMITLAPRYNSWTRSIGLHLNANVHDELLMEAPDEVASDPSVQQKLFEHLETPCVPLLIPIRVGMGVSNKSWKDADGDGPGKVSRDKSGKILQNVPIS